MVDLHGQYLKIKAEVDAAIQGVIQRTAFIKGPELHAFQEELAAYLHIPHVVACGNGTDALQVAMMALELEPGDEVITTPFTFIATVEVIRLLGLRPVFVDVCPESFNLDPEEVEKAISQKTRAIVPVHLFGQCAHMEALMKLALEHELFIIEDSAQALGADYYFSDGSCQKAGTIGHIGTTSFFPSKNLGAFGDGGALFTPDEKLAQRLASLVNHGMSRRYYYDHIGVNSRLDTLQAAILQIKLKHLDEYHRARQQAASFYDEHLQGISALAVPHRLSHSSHIFHQYTLKVLDGQRDGLSAWLQENNIPSMIYYPVPLHLQKAYQDLDYREGDLPVSEELCSQVLSLPMHTELEQEQLEYIVEQIRTFYS